MKLLGKTCYYCGSPASTVDHIVPKSKLRHVKNVRQRIEFGKKNMRPSCWSCNHYKGDKGVEEFRDFLKRKHASGSKAHPIKILAPQFIFHGEGNGST